MCSPHFKTCVLIGKESDIISVFCIVIGPNIHVLQLDPFWDRVPVVCLYFCQEIDLDLDQWMREFCAHRLAAVLLQVGVKVDNLKLAVSL